jgi:uracil phosphoribosyltransferase
MLNLIPAAKVGHIGLYRDPETHKPIEYYCKLPADCCDREVFVVDPMLATGGSAVAAIQMLKDKGCRNIHFMCIIAAPEGISFETPNDTTIVIKGADRQVVGSMAADIRAIRKPEPYLGKGIKYQGEHIRRKEGKTGKK